MEFESFEKISRLKRSIVITEKIDGTNGQIAFDEDMNMFVGSRNKWITPEQDNYGFARWAYENEECLRGLGVGRHYGEWWGQGIQRRYDMDRKVFSLFNTGRWGLERPECCSVVPELYIGDYNEFEIEKCLEDLSEKGSAAAEGYMNPEGIIIFHSAARKLFKVTLENDGIPKSQVA
jgi:RNA ligase-like protein